MTFHGPFLCVKISFHADYAYEYWVHFSATVCNGVEGFFASSRNIYLHSGSEFSMGAEITKPIPFFYHRSDLQFPTPRMLIKRMATILL